MKNVTIILFFLLNSTLVLATDYAFDSFAGMLEKRDGELVFIKCGHRDDPMKVNIVAATQEEKTSITQTINALKKHNRLQIRSIAHVEQEPEGSKYPYTIYIKEITQPPSEQSCHLSEFLETASPEELKMIWELLNNTSPQNIFPQ